MENKMQWKKIALRVASYILVAAVASAVTFFLYGEAPSKLDQLEALIGEKFIGEVDKTAIEDAAASSMIAALGDRWSYYIPAASYAAIRSRRITRMWASASPFLSGRTAQALTSCR